MRSFLALLAVLILAAAVRADKADIVKAVDARAVDLYQRPPAELSRKQASQLITVLKSAS